MNPKIIMPVLLGAIILLVGGFFLLNQNPEPQPMPNPSPSPTPTPTPVAEIPNDWLTYQNEKIGFEVKYPSNLVVGTENPEKRSVSFGDPNSEIGESILNIGVYQDITEADARKKAGFYTKSELLQLGMELFPPNTNTEEILDTARYWVPPIGAEPTPVPVEELFFEGKKALAANVDVRLGFKEGGYCCLGISRTVLLFEPMDTYVLISTSRDDTFFKQILSTFRFSGE